MSKLLDNNFIFLNEYEFESKEMIIDEVWNVCKYIKNFDDDKYTFFTKLRSILEHFLKVKLSDDIPNISDLKLDEIINTINNQFSKSIRWDNLNYMRTIRKYGNCSTHDPYGSKEFKKIQAINCLYGMKKIFLFFLNLNNDNKSQDIEFDETIYYPQSDDNSEDKIKNVSFENSIRNDIRIERQNLLNLILNDVVLSIPIFQRKYEWNEVNIRYLFKDIYEKIKIDKSHFFGSIVVHKKRDLNKNEIIYRIIDGQQRITTTLIIISVIKDIIAEKNKDNQPDEILKKVFDKQLSKFFKKLNATGSEEENQKLDEIFNGKLKNNQNNSKSSSNSIVLKNYNFIKSELLKKYDDDINSYYKFCFKYLDLFQLSLIFFDDDNISNKNEMEIFENINSRGKKLSLPALIKNYILNICNDEIIDENENKIIICYNRVFEIDSSKDNLIEEFYKSLSEYIFGEEVSKDDDKKFQMIRQTIYKFFDKTDSFNELNEFKRYIDKLEKYKEIYEWIIDKDFPSKNPADSLKDIINKSVICTIAPFEKKKRALLLPLSYLLYELDEKGLISNIDNNDRKLIRKMYSCISKFIIVSSINTTQGDSEIKRYIISEINKIREKIINDSSVKLKDLLLDIKDAFKNVKNKWNTEQFYIKLKANINNNSIVLALLNLIEMHMNNCEDTNSLTMTNYKMTLEHIMPIDPKEWFENDLEMQQKHSEYIDKIGNFIILDKSVNSKIKNKPFINKLEEYKKSNNQLIRNNDDSIDISRKYKWSFDDIDRRTEALIKYIKQNIIKE